MVFSRRCFLILLLGLCPAAFAASAKKQSARPTKDSSSYRGAIVVDAATGNVLFEEGEPILDFPEYYRLEKQLFAPVTGVQSALGDACFCSNPFRR